MNIKWTLRLVAILAAVALVAALLTFGPSACTSFFSAKTETRVAKGNEKAAIGSGAEAMNTVSNVTAADAEADQIEKDGIDAIRNAPEGQRADAALAASCGLRHNANKQRCARLRGAGAGVPADSR